YWKPLLDLASSARQSASQKLAIGRTPGRRSFDDRRRSPVSKLRIPLSQANVLLFSALKQQNNQVFRRCGGSRSRNCLGGSNPVVSPPFVGIISPIGVSMLRQRLNDDLKAAMKSRDQRATSTLRLILAALKDRDIAARERGITNGVDEPEIIDLLQ